MTIQIPYEAMPKMTPDISKDFQLGPIFTLEICLLILARKLLVFHHCNRGSQQKMQNSKDILERCVGSKSCLKIEKKS